VWELRDVELSRPVTSAVELSAICLSARLRSRADAGQLQRILLDAREEEITRALERVGRQLAVPDDAAAIDLERVLRYLADMPEPHCGRLGGLVAKAIEWHRAWNRRSLAEALAAAGFQSTEGILDVPTRRPPFALPDVSGIRFLRTVEDVALEGQRMNHCVVTRARAALRGDCDLFHVEHQGEQATVELSKHGNVIEAGGPRNLRNRAVTWGRDVLREWWRTSSRIGGDGGSPEVLLLPSGKAAQRRGCFDARRDEWALAVRTLRSAGGDEPDWLADLERFRAKVVADESAPRRAARRPAGRTSTG
jgi:hypothetical protein